MPLRQRNKRRFHVHSCLLSRECWRVDIWRLHTAIVLMVRDTKREKNLVYWVVGSPWK